ncbi:hypothetical protein ACFE04_013590 [Oxalis oulophora]
MVTNFHVRSISLPSGSHPLVTSIQEQLRRLTTSQETTSSSSTLCHKLDGLKNLYECVDDLLQLNEGQHLSDESLDEALNGSIRLLDMCDISRDVLSRMKECVRIVPSHKIRKNNAKVVCKSLKTFKRSETKRVNCDQDSAIKMLSEAEAISIKVFQSLMSLMSEPKNNDGWFSVSILFKPKRVSCESLLRRSGDLNSSIEELEQNLECLYRRFVKTRVTLLNILNN